MKPVRVLVSARNPRELRGMLSFEFDSDERRTFEIPYLFIVSE
jgi:hypothetical protein